MPEVRQCLGPSGMAKAGTHASKASSVSDTLLRPVPSKFSPWSSHANRQVTAELKASPVPPRLGPCCFRIMSRLPGCCVSRCLSCFLPYINSSLRPRLPSHEGFPPPTPFLVLSPLPGMPVLLVVHAGDPWWFSDPGVWKLSLLSFCPSASHSASLRLWLD